MKRRVRGARTRVGQSFGRTHRPLNLEISVKCDHQLSEMREGCKSFSTANHFVGQDRQLPRLDGCWTYDNDLFYTVQSIPAWKDANQIN